MKDLWNTSAASILNTGPVIPVLVIENPQHALPIAEALLEGGIKVLEITLRTQAAIDIIHHLSATLPEALIGAGTVTSVQSLQQAGDAGARFLISPGLTPTLLQAATRGPVPLIPGISSIGELMTGMEYGLDCFKFFPAEAAGGRPMLKAIAGPFPDILFCPTGGITPDNASDYLAMPNVTCIGGSWLVTADIIRRQAWPEITRLCRDILDRTGTTT